jgi:hypothetical protein
MPHNYVRPRAFGRAESLARRHAHVSPYVPILGHVVLSVAAGLAIAFGFGGAVGMSLHAIIGFFLCSHALLKLLDVSHFAEGFSRFDLIAGRWRGYGFLFPFLELGLGLGYFSFIAPAQVYLATAVLFTFTLAGLLSARHNGLRLASTPIQSGIRAPVALAALVESVVMTALAMVLMWM